MYLVTLLNEFPRGASTFAMLGETLISALKTLRGSDDSSIYASALEPEFFLWMMFVAASIVDKPTVKAFFLAGSVDAMQLLKIGTWEEVEVILKSFFWVDRIHAKSFGNVWKELVRS